MDVKARLYLRDRVEKLGVAPLTSMFLIGENQPSASEDYRPEVHDSDGLSVQSGSGEWIWRPLVNPRRLLVTSYAMNNPRGFGLMQRDRAFSSYEEVHMRYELRPSAWVEPKGKWGAGRVELVQIPTPDETNDNIVAFWVPEQPPQEKRPYELEYRLLWQKDAEARPPLAWVMQTRRGRAQSGKAGNSFTFVIDFVGPIFGKLAAKAKVETVVSVDANGELLGSNTYRNDATDGWRVMLRVRRIDDKKPVEMRGLLKSGNETLSETWSYILPPI
jgi:glucans biosynthesis protein